MGGCQLSLHSTVGRMPVWGQVGERCTCMHMGATGGYDLEASGTGGWEMGRQGVGGEFQKQ